MRSNANRATGTTAAVALLVTGLALAGCAGQSSDAAPEDSTDGIAFGASKEDYQAAFADVEPITLKFQTSGPQGSLPNVAPEAYAAAVEDWSDGKITFEWGYSNGFVPAATEWAAGLGDGRIDIGQFAPYYNPEVFPQLNAVTDASFLDGNLPLSTLVSTGWITESTLADPVYADEAEAGGVHLLTVLPTANIAGIFCTDERTSLEDFSGVPISASGKGRFEQLTSLGFAPQSIAFTELYEAIERSIVECGSTVPSALDSIGATELVPYAIADPEASLVSFPIYLAFGSQKWDALPLVAQQLLYDRLDEFLINEVTARSERNSDWLDQVLAADGGILALEEDARDALLATNDKLLDEIAARGADTDAFVANVDKWREIVDGELYPDVTDDLEAFLADREYDDLDFQPFVDRFFQDVLLPARPGS